MSNRPAWNKGIIFSVLALNVTVVILICLWLSLPHIIEDYVLPEILKKSGLKEYRAEVYSFDIQGLSFSFDILENGKKAFSMPINRIAWSFPAILKGEVESITLYSPAVRTVFRDNKLTIKGIPLSTVSDQDVKSARSKSFILSKLPLKVKHLNVLNSRVFIEHGGRDDLLALSVEITPEYVEGDEGGGYLLSHVDGELTFLFNGVRLKKHILYDPAVETVHVKGELQGLCISAMRDIIPIPDNVFIKGCMDIYSDLSLSLHPFRVKKVSIDARMNDFLVNQGSFHVSSAGDKVCRLKIKGQGDSLRYEISKLNIRYPSRYPLETGVEIAGTVEAAYDRKRFKGLKMKNRLHLSFNNISTIPEFSDLSFEPKTISTEIFSTFVIDASGNWSLKSPLPEKEKVDNWADIRKGGLHIITGEPTLTMKGGGNPETWDIDYGIYLHNIKIDDRENSLFIKSAGVNGNLGYVNGLPSINGNFSITGGYYSNSMHHFEAGGISAFLPCLYPLEAGEESKTGDLYVKFFRYDGLDVGSYHASLLQTGDGITSYGSFKTSLLKDSAVTTGTNVVFKDSVPVLDTTAKVHDAGFDIGPFKKIMRELGAWDMTGKVDAEIRFHKDGCRTESGVTLSLSGLSAYNKDILFNLRGGKLDVAIGGATGALDKISSPPSQRFSFDSLEAGKIKLDNGKIFFRMDDLRDFTVENMSFDWCGGKLYGENIHIQPGIEEYSASLFCQELQLAEILNLFNGVKARGNGTLNGRLPLFFSKGRLRVEKGLLISAPGEGGIIRLSASTLLKSGISPENFSSAELDFAATALKRFRYDWARLDVNSNKDILDVRLKIKGRPADPLPFSYNKNGMIVRNSRESNKGGIVHPVQLDVNFFLPVDKLFHYGLKWHNMTGSR